MHTNWLKIALPALVALVLSLGTASVANAASAHSAGTVAESAYSPSNDDDNDGDSDSDPNENDDGDSDDDDDANSNDDDDDGDNDDANSDDDDDGDNDDGDFDGDDNDTDGNGRTGSNSSAFNLNNFEVITEICGSGAAADVAPSLGILCELFASDTFPQVAKRGIATAIAAHLKHTDPDFFRSFRESLKRHRFAAACEGIGEGDDVDRKLLKRCEKAEGRSGPSVDGGDHRGDDGDDDGDDGDKKKNRGRGRGRDRGPVDA